VGFSCQWEASTRKSAVTKKQERKLSDVRQTKNGLYCIECGPNGVFGYT
jgi:hypothetical protein